MPLMRKFWPLVLKNRLPTRPGSKNEICTLSQFSRYTAPFHCRRWSKNSVFQPISLLVELVRLIGVRDAVLRLPSGPEMCGVPPFRLNAARTEALREGVVQHDVRRDVPA